MADLVVGAGHERTDVAIAVGQRTEPDQTEVLLGTGEAVEWRQLLEEPERIELLGLRLGEQIVGHVGDDRVRQVLDPLGCNGRGSSTDLAGVSAPW